MYYLAKFCRICIQTDQKLTEIESVDYDSVKLSDKLKTCTQMVINEDSISTKICTSCIQKLRISYQFHSMCNKSTMIIQQYISEMLQGSEHSDADNFINSELKVTIVPLQKLKKKRVSKDERCSLLKKLLSKITEDQLVQNNIHLNNLTKLCDNLKTTTNSKTNLSDKSEAVNKKIESKTGHVERLRQFINKFDYGYDLQKNSDICNNCDLTPLERLKQFTNSFFFDHFSDYRDAVVYLSDNFHNESSEDENMFENVELKTEIDVDCCKKEFIVVEPDIVIKKEVEVESDCEEIITDFSFTSNLVQTCYDENLNNSCNNLQQKKSVSPKNFSVKNRFNIHLPPLESAISINSSSANITPKTETKTLACGSSRCRTRGNPYISPQLKKQFLYRNFTCEVCKRRFKSPGYLKGHRSKVKH